MSVEKIILEYEVKFKKLDKDVEKIKAKLSDVEKEAKKSAGGASKAFQTLKTVFAATFGAITLTSIISEVKQLVSESIKLAEQAEGIKYAFNQLNDPLLLDNLRRATKGTVSDLELMKAAVQAEKFGIPVKNLGEYLQFAAQRAKETGQSVDYLVNSIIIGIGRRSPMILDNLSISTAQLRDELEALGGQASSVEDIGEAVANIIRKNRTQDFNTAAEAVQRYNAQVQNLKLALGELLLPLKQQIVEVLNMRIELLKAGDVLGALAPHFQSMGGGLSALRAAYIDLQAEQEKARKQLEAITGELEKQIELYKKADDKTRIELAEQYTKRLNSLVTIYQSYINSERLSNKERERAKKKLETLIYAQREYTKAISENDDALNKNILTLNYFQETISALQNIIKDTNIRGNKFVQISIELLETQQQQIDEIARTILSAPISDYAKKNLLELYNISTEQANKIYEQIKGIPFFTVVEPIQKLQPELEKAFDTSAQQIEQLEAGMVKLKQTSETITEIIPGTIADMGIVFQTFQHSINAALDALYIFGQENERVARWQKALSMAMISINAGEALSKAITSIKGLTGFDLIAQIASVTAIVTRTIAQAMALTRQANIPAFSGAPRFAEGVIDLQGKGTSKSDSIPAWLSKGESVMTAEETKKYLYELRAMRDNTFEDYIYKKYVLPVVKEKDNKDLLIALHRNKSVKIENVKELSKAIAAHIDKYDKLYI